MPRTSLATRTTSSSAPASTACRRRCTSRASSTARGKTVGAGGTRIVVLDKTGIGAGASGIACGVVRNNYLPAGDARADGALRVGLGNATPRRTATTRSATCRSAPESMHAQVGTIYEQQKAIGYESVFVEGEAESHALHAGHPRTTGRRRTSRRCCTRSAAATRTTWRRCAGLAAKARGAGVEIVEGVTVTRLHMSHGAGHVTAVEQRPRASSAATRSSSASVRGSTRSGTCSTLPKTDRRSRAATASSTRACRCGTTWRCRKARSASIPITRRPTTAGCRR